MASSHLFVVTVVLAHSPRSSLTSGNYIPAFGEVFGQQEQFCVHEFDPRCLIHHLRFYFPTATKRFFPNIKVPNID